MFRQTMKRLSKTYSGWREIGLPEPIIKEEYGPDRTTLILLLIEESTGKNRSMKSVKTR